MPVDADLFKPASVSGLRGVLSEGKGRFLRAAEAEGRGDEGGDDEGEDGEEELDDTRAAMAWRSRGRSAGQLVAKRAGRDRRLLLMPTRRPRRVGRCRRVRARDRGHALASQVNEGGLQREGRENA